MPQGIVVAIIFEALVLAYGGVVHLLQLASGWPPYPWAPDWLAAYFASLTLLDPLAALLLLARRAAGLYLAVFVMVTDAGAIWYASYYLPHGTAATRLAQALISGLAIASLMIANYARPWTRQSCLGTSPPSS